MIENIMNLKYFNKNILNLTSALSQSEIESTFCSDNTTTGLMLQHVNSRW